MLRHTIRPCSNSLPPAFCFYQGNLGNMGNMDGNFGNNMGGGNFGNNMGGGNFGNMGGGGYDMWNNQSDMNMMGGGKDKNQIILLSYFLIFRLLQVHFVTLGYFLFFSYLFRSFFSSIALVFCLTVLP